MWKPVSVLLVSLSGCGPADSPPPDLHDVETGPAVDLPAPFACEPLPLIEQIRRGVLAPEAHTEVTPSAAESALIFETPAGRRAVLDIHQDRVAEQAHVELWIEGDRVQTIEVVEDVTIFDPLYPRDLEAVEADVASLALALLALRLDHAGCPDCCLQARQIARYPCESGSVDCCPG